MAAYVYVAERTSNTSPNQIVAYAANANGQLTPVSGSPFKDNVGPMATNGTYLMGAAQSPGTNPTKTTAYINAYKIGSDGSLTLAAQTNLDKFGSGCVDGGTPQFDRTGKSLYVLEDNFDCTGVGDAGNSGMASFTVDSATGNLTYLGVVDLGRFGGIINGTGRIDFTSNDLYAYGPSNDSCMYYSTYGFVRSGNGMLNLISNFTPQSTPTSSAFRIYIPLLSAADSANHLAIAEAPANPPGCSTPIQLATYTAGANGELTTTDTYATMPKTSISSPYDMKISPSGTLLAIAGQEGLQVFHFNGDKPIMTYTGLLTTDPIQAIAWDNQNHLYAITSPDLSGSANANKLYVFTVTDTTATQATGSPYSIEIPYNLAVQAK